MRKFLGSILGAVLLIGLVVFGMLWFVVNEGDASALADAVQEGMKEPISKVLNRVVGFDIRDYDKKPVRTLKRGVMALQRGLDELQRLQREVSRGVMDAEVEVQKNERNLKTSREQGLALQAHLKGGGGYPVEIGGYTYTSAAMLESVLRNTAQKAAAEKAKVVYVRNNLERFRAEQLNVEMAMAAANKAMSLLETKLTYAEGTEVLKRTEALMADLESMYSQFDSLMTEEDVGKSVDPGWAQGVKERATEMLEYDFGE
jgi:hypothetical protein